MGTHPDGTGTGWDVCEAVDADQPHGLDYRFVNHLAIAVRKRNNKEHEAYGDTTAGGEHLPGGCRVLGIVDATADLTAAAGDASHDVTTTKFIGRGIMYDQTSNVLWCLTNTDGTTTGNPYALMWGPKSICLGADFSWTGTHEFSDVDISGSLDLTGHFACGSEVVGEASASFTGDVDISKSLNCASALVVDGTAVFTSAVDVSGSIDVSGTWSGKCFPSAWFKADWTTGTIHANHNVGGVDQTADGKTCVSFTSNLASAHYAVILTPLCLTGTTVQSTLSCCSQTTSGFTVQALKDSAVLTNDHSEFFGVVFI